MVFSAVRSYHQFLMSKGGGNSLYPCGEVLWDTSVQQLWGKVFHTWHWPFYLAVYGIWNMIVFLLQPPSFTLPILSALNSSLFSPLSFTLCSTILPPLKSLFSPLHTRKVGRRKVSFMVAGILQMHYRKERTSSSEWKWYTQSVPEQLSEWWPGILSHVTRLSDFGLSLWKDFTPYFH